MNKKLIKTQVKQAYLNAKKYPDFLQQFKHEIQIVIDKRIPGSVTHYWHVSEDINILSRRSSENGYKVDGFLKLVSEYIFMLIKSVENHEKQPFESIDQRDLFQSNDLQKDKKKND